MPPLPTPIAIVLALTGLIAGAFDWRYRRIPNWLVIGGFSAGVLVQIFAQGLDGASSSVQGAGVAIAIYLPLYLLRAVGGGDLKLAVALGAITGPATWLVLFILWSLLGGAAAVAVLLAKSRFRQTLGNICRVLWELVHFRPPYRGRPDLDVANNQSVSIPHGTVIGTAIALYICGIWLR